MELDRRNPVIAVDMDGVIADLHKPWLQLYNEEFNDTVQPEDIKGWGLSTYLKPECGNRIWKYLSDPRLFKMMQLIPGAREGIAHMRAHGVRVIVVTSCVEGSQHQKWLWLRQQGILDDLKDYYPVADKSLIRAAGLIDDGVHNLETFLGQRILFDAPHNREECRFNRMKSWDDRWILNELISFATRATDRSYLR